jgi:hypothetical protein
MQETITPILIDASSQYPKVYLTAKKYYGCSKEIAVQLKPHQSYTVALSVRQVKKKDGSGTFDAKDIVDIVFADPAKPPVPSPIPVSAAMPTLQAPVLNERDESIKKMAQAKNETIGRSAALNNAAVMVAAYAHVIAATDMVKGMGEEEVRNWLTSMKTAELKENYKILGVEPELEF